MVLSQERTQIPLGLKKYIQPWGSLFLLCLSLSSETKRAWIPPWRLCVFSKLSHDVNKIKQVRTV